MLNRVKEKLLEAVQEVDALEEMTDEYAREGAMIVGIRLVCDAVREFHKKNGIDVRERLFDTDHTVAQPMEAREMSEQVKKFSSRFLELFKALGDHRNLRSHLVLEEAGAELVDAMMDSDEVKTLDALCDAVYVLVGTAVVFDLPLAEGLVEVHRSNMSKERQKTDEDGARVRDKGPNYSPPDFAGVIRAYRVRQLGSHRFSGSLGSVEDFQDVSRECCNCGMSMGEILRQVDEHGRGACRGSRVQ